LIAQYLAPTISLYTFEVIKKKDIFMTKTAIDLVKDAKRIISELEVTQAQVLLTNNCIALDVREHAEFESGHIPNAHHISRGVLEFKILGHDAFQDKQQAILVYCKTGGRSALATAALAQLGYTNVHSMIGGYDAWLEHV